MMAAPKKVLVAKKPEEPAKPAQVLQCERLLKFTNPREDIIQLLRSTVLT